MHLENRKWRKDIHGLRGLAILSTLFHAHRQTIFPDGYIAVSIFFVISGYLTTDTLHNRLTSKYLRIYTCKKIKRIVPLYYFIILLILIKIRFFSSIKSLDNIEIITFKAFAFISDDFHKLIQSNNQVLFF